MPRAPSIVPDDNQAVYLVLDDFGRIGSAWRETNVEETDFETIINDLLEGQFCNPVRIVSFNTAEGWSRDASQQVVHELRQRCANDMRELPPFLEDFVNRYGAPYHSLQLPLPIGV